MAGTARNKTIQARVSEEEYAFIEERADFFGLTISNYVRLVVLNANIEVNVKIGELDHDE
jgi:uncharacterized protein (DUF1778 family)